MNKGGKFAFSLLVLGLTLAFISPQKAFAEQILNYTAEIKVNQDSHLDVKETIVYDFGVEERHGIYRDIPYTITNNEGKKFKFDINVNSVEYGDGSNVEYTNSISDDNLHIKIGDPDHTITGVNTYVISYSVKGAATYFADHDELYWNAIGTGWTVSIRDSTVKIDLSDLSGLTNSNVKLDCYTGLKGSTKSYCIPEVKVPNVTIQSSTHLSEFEGLTFALTLPKGTLQVVEPKPYKWWDGLSTALLWTIGLAIISLLAAIIYWFLFGRDPIDTRVLVRMYDAPKGPDGKELSPLEVGTIVDEKIQPKDISAEVINLAILKYIIIEEVDSTMLGRLITPRKTTLHQGPKLKGDPENLLMLDLKDHQRDIIKAFGLDTKETVTIGGQDSALARKFDSLKKDLFVVLTQKGYFHGNPEKIRNTFLTAGGIGLIVLSAVPFFYPIAGPCIVLIGFSFLMPRKTKLGVEAKRYALGLKQFLVSQDRQFEFQEKNMYLFEKLLPYAISFGVAKIWAKKFEDLGEYKPDWYSSNSLSALNAINIASSIETSMNSSIGTSSGSSSSGGSSGGGGGGGGG